MLIVTILVLGHLHITKDIFSRQHAQFLPVRNYLLVSETIINNSKTMMKLLINHLLVPNDAMPCIYYNYNERLRRRVARYKRGDIRR